MNLHGARVLITGGSSGIGLALARAMASRGASVTITGRDAARLDAAASDQPSIRGVVCDVTSDAEVRGLRDQLVAEVDIDVNGPLRLVDAFLPSLLERTSVIVNVSSGLAWVPYVAAPVYSGAKAFVHEWTVALRVQLASTSVRVVELLPPVTDTPLADGLAAGFARMPPEEVAAALLRGLARDADEIAPGSSAPLEWLARLSPRLALRLLNRPTTGGR